MALSVETIVVQRYRGRYDGLVVGAPRSGDAAADIAGAQRERVRAIGEPATTAGGPSVRPGADGAAGDGGTRRRHDLRFMRLALLLGRTR